jgi:hypothetical protein
MIAAHKIAIGQTIEKALVLPNAKVFPQIRQSNHMLSPAITKKNLEVSIETTPRIEKNSESAHNKTPKIVAEHRKYAAALPGLEIICCHGDRESAWDG